MNTTNEYRHLFGLLDTVDFHWIPPCTCTCTCSCSCFVTWSYTTLQSIVMSWRIRISLGKSAKNAANAQKQLHQLSRHLTTLYLYIYIYTSYTIPSISLFYTENCHLCRCTNTHTRSMMCSIETNVETYNNMYVAHRTSLTL